MDMKKRTNIYLDAADKALLAVIKEHYNLNTDAAAVRFALAQLVARLKAEKKEE